MKTYHPYFPFHVCIGEEVTVVDVEYYCLVEYTIIGYTHNTKEPVI